MRVLLYVSCAGFAALVATAFALSQSYAHDLAHRLDGLALPALTRLVTLPALGLSAPGWGPALFWGLLLALPAGAATLVARTPEPHRLVARWATFWSLALPVAALLVLLLCAGAALPFLNL